MNRTATVLVAGRRALFHLIPLALIAALLLGFNLRPAVQHATLPTCLGRQSRPCLGPSDLHRLYEEDGLLGKGMTGRGKTIALIESFGSPTMRADLHAFDRAFSLPDPRLDIVAPLGAIHGGNKGWAMETTLDVEWVHAIAPGARLLLLLSPVDETEGTQGLPQFLTLERYAVAHGADVISQSWAATEDTLLDKQGRAMVASFHQFFQQATARGVTFVGASGDDGAAGLDQSLRNYFPGRAAQWPASEPSVLAVGGTRLESGTRSAEEAWTGSGGGLSKLYSEPAYQQSLAAETEHLLAGRRGLPDVSAIAATPVLTVHGGRWALGGGTSLSAPLWAGLLAVGDQLAGHDLGDVHASLYRIARSSKYHRDFHDVLRGSIHDPAGAKGPPLHAGPGWDPATGLGTPRAAELLPDLAKLTITRR